MGNNMPVAKLCLEKLGFLRNFCWIDTGRLKLLFFSFILWLSSKLLDTQTFISVKIRNTLLRANL